MRIGEKAKPSISREISEACVSRFSNAFPFLRSHCNVRLAPRCYGPRIHIQVQVVGNGVTERDARSRDGAREVHGVRAEASRGKGRRGSRGGGEGTGEGRRG